MGTEKETRKKRRQRYILHTCQTYCEYQLDKLYNDYPLLKYRRHEKYENDHISTPKEIEFEKNGIYDNYDEMGYVTTTNILTEIREYITKDDIFYDLGSGLGKITTHFYYDTPCKKIVGIEYFEDLHNVAVQVRNKMEIAKDREVCYYQKNICDVDINEATIVYFGIINGKGAKISEHDILIHEVYKKLIKSPNVRIVISLCPLYIPCKMYNVVQCVPSKINGREIISDKYPFNHYFYIIR